MVSEEDIKILENAIQCNKKQFEELGTHILLQDDEMNALEKLLQGYKYLDKFIHSNSCVVEDKEGILVGVLLTPENYIPKSLVEEKIEERKLWLSSNDISYKDDYVLEVLEELLKGDKQLNSIE